MRIAAAMLALFAAWSQQAPVGPPPPGPLAIDRATYVWKDAARGRELQVYVWHPTPLTKRPWPVVLFSHGAGTPVATYTAKLNDLAGHGYIVVAPEYPADPSDPSRCRAPAGTPYDEMVETGMRCLRERAEIVAADIRFAVDRVADMNRASGASPDFEGRLDLAHLAAAGHSLGGFASVRACQLDARIAACVNEDGGTADGIFLRYAGASSVKQPLLYVEASVPSGTDQQLAAMGSSRADWNARLDHMLNVVHEQQMRSAGAGSYKVSLHAPGIGHGSFGDLYLSSTTDEARQLALHNLALTEAVTRAFLDKHLKGATDTLLDDPRAGPEMVVKRY